MLSCEIYMTVRIGFIEEKNWKEGEKQEVPTRPYILLYIMFITSSPKNSFRHKNINKVYLT